MFGKINKIIVCITTLLSFESMASQEYLHTWKSLDYVSN